MKKYLDRAEEIELEGNSLKKHLKNLSGELDSFYKWVREKNGYASDDVVDYMWKAVKEKMKRDMEIANSLMLTADERAEFMELDEYSQGFDNVNKPINPAEPRYRRYCQLRKKMDE